MNAVEILPVDYDYDFQITSRSCRVHSGHDALKNLPSELRRHGAKRAFVICGRTVSRATGLIDHIRGLLGDSLAGVFDEMGKDTPISAVLAAADQARAAKADLLIAVGAGSVIQGVRAVAIALAEARPLPELATQYPENGQVISPRLLAPKLPIINVVTVATSAQNRSGAPLKVHGQHRIELFDPKTRPAAIFWDPQALMTAPAAMHVTSAAAIFWRAVMNMGYTGASPLSDFNRRQAFALSENALRRVADAGDASARLDLCIATFLQNRDADDGGGRIDHWVMRVIYAFAASIFHEHEHVTQGEANSALTPTVLRKLGHRDPTAMCRIAEALGVWTQADAVEEAPSRAADEMERIFGSLGLPIRISQLNIPQSSLQTVLANSLQNYNSDPRREFAREEQMLGEVLQAAW